MPLRWVIVHICYCTIFPFLEYFVAVVHHRCYSNTAAQMSSPKDTPIVNGVLDMYFKIGLVTYSYMYIFFAKNWIEYVVSATSCDNLILCCYFMYVCMYVLEPIYNSNSTLSMKKVFYHVKKCDCFFFVCCIYKLLLEVTKYIKNEIIM